MKEAYQLDWEANEKRNASTEKLKKLPEIEMKLRSAVLSRKFLENNGQRVLVNWLSRLPDKTEPNFSFRMRLYNLLIDMKAPSFESVSELHGTIRQIYLKGSKKLNSTSFPFV